MVTTTTRLYDIIEWARKSGEVRAVERIRLKVLTASIDEGISLMRVSPETTCSSRYLEAVWQAASDVVGEPCPYRPFNDHVGPVSQRRK
jgi:hypothetical protein